MSTFDGAAQATTNADLQLAPAENRGPDFATLKTAFNDCILNQQGFVDQCRLNYTTRYCLWPGQSSDGKKHSREGSKVDPTPWDGASDLRVYEVDGAINRKVALLRTAFKRANIIASPVEGNDFKRAKMVSNFLKYLVRTKIPGVDAQIALLANYIQEKGIGAIGVFWCDRQEKTLVSVTLADLQKQFPDLDIMALLADDLAAEQIAAIFEEQYGCSNAKAKRMIKDLRAGNETTVPTLGRKHSYPVIRAFNMDEQLFVPAETADPDYASGMYRIEYFTPEQLRAFVKSDGWDEQWVEDAIENARGKWITPTPSLYPNPINRSFVYQQQQPVNKNQIGVCYAYQRLSDEDGYSGCYLTIFNPELPPKDRMHKGYAKFELMRYANGEYPFVIFRREHLSRIVQDTRGLPEPGKSFQDAIKAHRDSRIDAASIAIIPPMGFPMGRPPSRWGPGARVPERRPGEFHFMDRPTVDGLTENSEAIMDRSFKDYCGFANPEGDPAYVQAMMQNEIGDFLSGVAKVFSKVYDLYQVYGDERVFFRVVGLQQPDLSVFQKGAPSERFDFTIEFDIQSMDTEKMAMKWDAAFKGFQLLDRNGNVNYTSALSLYLESIDANWAEAVLEPTEVGQQRVAKEEQDDLTKIFAGWNVNVRPGTPPQLGLQIMQMYLQSPDVQQRMQTDQAFRERIEARAKQYNMGMMQQQNKLIGRQGAIMPGPVVQTGQPSV